jgi:hypothetical protein
MHRVAEPEALVVLGLEPADTGSSDITDLGTSGWAVQSSAVASQTGAQISTPGFNTSTWLPVTNDDAGAPGTEIEALAQNGRCPGDPALQPVNQNTSGTSSVFYSTNIKSCYGFMSAIGADTVPEFDVPWWWRTDLSSSALTVKTDITNNTSTAQAGLVTATITPPGGGTPITVSQTVTVPAATTQTVSFTPSAYPALTIASPQVWWPYQMGAQPLYTLTTQVAQNATVLNSTSETFGIRNITSYLTTGTSKGAPNGARAFKVNGVPIVIRGGGFSPNIFLHYSAADIAKQIALMKNMGVNTIRLEGHIMPADFFQQMDQAGMLVNAGYQCCDAWELQSSGLTTAADFAIMQNSALTIGQNLRNHPSVFSFQWSDQPPTAMQESVSLAAFSQADFQDPIISSAEYQSSP